LKKSNKNILYTGERETESAKSAKSAPGIFFGELGEIGKKQEIDLPDEKTLYPRRTAFGSVVLEPLDALDQYALSVIEDWDLERKARKLALRPTISPKVETQAKSAAEGRQ
jgi:hypothetical protein